MGFVDLLKNAGFETTTIELHDTANKPHIIEAKRVDTIFKYLVKSARSCNIVVYDAISGNVKTPTIVYVDKNEVVYDFIEGCTIENMLTENHSNDRNAVMAAGMALRKFHDAGCIHGDANTGNFIYSNGECFILDIDINDSIYIGERFVEYFMRRHDISLFGLDLEGDCRRAHRPVSDMVELERLFMVGYNGENPVVRDSHPDFIEKVI